MKTQGQNTLFLLNAFDHLEKEIQRNSMVKLHKEAGTYDATFGEIPPYPEKGDFMFFPFRHLSATIVGGGTWKATDFSDVKVLKAGHKKLMHKPAYLNHNLYVGQEVGYIGEPDFTGQYTNVNKQTVPAGIDAPFVIDKVLYPALVRKLSSEVSPIQSASVSVLFQWEASHDFEKEYDFYYHLGEIIDGSMVRRVVTQIEDFYESSLVWLGADPYAKMLVEGEVVNIDSTSVVYNGSFQQDPFNKYYNNYKKYFIFDCHDPQITLDLKKWTAAFSKTQSDTMNFQELIAQMLGIPKEQVTPEMLQKFSFVPKEDAEKFKQFQANSKSHESSLSVKDNEIATLKKDVEAKDTELVDLRTFKTSAEADGTKNKPFIEMGQKAFEASKKNATELYTKVVQGKTEKAILDEIEHSTVESLNAKITMWGGQMFKKFGAKCKKCSSNEVEFRSSVVEEDGNIDDNDTIDSERPVLSELVRQ